MNNTNYIFEQNINRDEFVYCRPECRDRHSVYIGGGDARKAAVESNS